MARAPRAAARHARARAAPVAVPADPQLLPGRARAGAHRRGRARARGAVADRADGPAATVERRGALRTLLDDLARLPELQRHALLRRELDGALARRARGRARAHRGRHAQPRAPRARRAHPRRRGPRARLRRRPPRHPRRPRRPPPADRPHAAPPRDAARPAARCSPRCARSAAARRARAARRAAGRARADRPLRRLAREGDDDRDDRGARRRRLGRALPGRRSGADGAGVDRAARQAARRRRADPRRRRDRPPRGPLSRTSAPSTLSCPPGLRLADLLPPEGGRVSAHYDATTTIGADQVGRVVLTGAGRGA